MVILNSGEQITSEMIIKSLSTTVRNYTAVQPIPTQSAQFVQPAMGTNDSYQNTTNGHIKNNTGIQPLWQVEKDAIEAAILHCQGNIPKAAAMLEVSPSTIYRKKLGW